MKTAINPYNYKFMRNFVLTVALFCVSLLSSGSLWAQQSVTPDARLYDAFGQTYVDQIVKSNPFLVQRFNYFLDHGWYIEQVAPGKDGQVLPEVTLQGNKPGNVLKMLNEGLLKRDQERAVRYKITGSNSMLVMRSEKEFASMLNKHLGRQ